MTEIQSEMIDGTHHIALPRVLDISNAADLKDVILDIAEPGSIINLEANGVEQLTTPGVQILLAATSFIERKKAKLTMSKPSGALIEGFSDLGLFSHLMAWNIE